MGLGSLAPVGRQQFLDANGDPLAAGLLYTYAAGTSTPSPIYTDANLAVPHPNPVVLDAGGYATLYMGALAQKWILKDVNAVTQWTVDPVSSVGLSAGGGAYEIFSFGGDSTSPISATSYPSGATLDKTHAGTALMVIDPTNLAAGTYVINATVIEAGGGLVSVALVDLLSGSPDVPLAVASGVSTTGAAVQSAAITFPAGGVAHTFAIKTQTSAGAAFAFGIHLAKIG